MQIELGDDEALVLSDWLDRMMHRRDFKAVVDDRAVWSALLTVSGSLETRLPQIFSPSYQEDLDAARARLVAGLGDFGADDGA
ncbi:hypothetical protein [Streptomyces sp. CMB-StM0423]|uniref:hypothetical protein n=1 Tax=Streptomyces sp. CMB-StM0423 TaxID=2059884 RepID=UPI000C70282F|nr:hypothetical protein [Streptomyces sp. CMB-StM0423]AUH39509.1 hypothetical protein CXR04_03895 [Streptomyces sp. CMB-StM0423]